MNEPFSHQDAKGNRKTEMKRSFMLVLCSHERGPHALERMRWRKRERDSVFPRQPMRIQYTPTRLGLCVATHTLTRHMCPCSSPPRNSNPALSQSEPHSPPTLMRFLLDVFDNNLFHPSKRVGHGKKGPALEALLHLSPWLSRETKSLRRHHSAVQLPLKRDGDQIPLIHNKTTL